MKLFVGLDVSLEKTAICVVSEHGKILREAQVASAPEALVRWLRLAASGSRPHESQLAIAAPGRPGPSVKNLLTQTAPLPKS